MNHAADLRQQSCQPQSQALNSEEIAQRLQAVAEWRLQDGKIVRSYAFKNYYATLAFVNAIAYVIHTEDHHPDLKVTYNRCAVSYHTHSVNQGKGGLSDNDFICAAKLDAIFEYGTHS